MNLNSLLVKTIRTRSQLYNYQTVRWLRPRKPFWLGIAKSKMFKLPRVRVVYTPEEQKKNLDLKRQYNTEMKSLLHFIRHDNPKLNEMLFESVGGEEKKQSPALEKSIAESYKNNESWNAECARIRELRLKSSEEKVIQEAMYDIDAFKERKKKDMETIEEIVRKEKVLSESFITPENLDEEIEKCLDRIDCFDFAIDLDGNKYEGRKRLTSTQQSTSTENKPVEAS